MKTTPVTLEDLKGVFPVPPLARRRGSREIDFRENDKLVAHIRAGGPARLLYGGNAFLYHVTLADYERVLDWMAGQDDSLWMIPSAGPSYGRLLDQAPLLARHEFPCVMVLPCGDPRDAEGLECGLREFAEAARTRLMLYVKDEGNFGLDTDAGLDAVARLVTDRTCVAIKYAVVRRNPADDPYLSSLLRRVPPDVVISGIGERPAVVHMRDFKLPGFTTGSGCIAPNLSQSIFEACRRGDYATAESLRERFLPFEDVRDAMGPARVLHAGVEAAGIARMGAISPFVSEVKGAALDTLQRAANHLAAESLSATGAAAR